MLLTSRRMPCIIVCFVLSTLISTGRTLSRTKRGGWMPAGTRPPGVACAFNPCSVPNFCGTGRTCELDSNCFHHCRCDPNSEHELCATTTDKDDGNEVANVTTTEKTVSCTFNPCNSPFAACTEGRKCELDAFCRVVCICTDESTHSSCDDGAKLNSTTTTTTVTTTKDKQGCGFNSNFGCEHGQCVSDESMMRCKCDDGWAGAKCDKNKSACALSCKVGFECMWYSGSIQLCVPIKSDSMRNVSVCNAAYTIRSNTERDCGPDMQCKYGACSRYNGTPGCECDPGAQGPRCEFTCCKDCGVNSTCILNDDNEEICECVGNFTGENCTRTDDPQAKTLTEEPTWHLWVVGACIVVLVALLFLIVFVPYIMWRHRVILVMKIVHFFQSYEDDDDRSWDAFVSYKSVEKDEAFVVHTLFPKLEQELGFRLNLHFRDFNPGENISNNIIKAVRSSRRTIMVVTPQYVQSEFTKLEMQVAQEEMLKRRHRIIPVLLEDVKDCSASMDPNLKMILGSVTYIQWPGHDADTKKIDAFWKRLKLALPKKRPVESETNSVALHSSNWPSSTVSPDSIAVKIVNENGIAASERCENVYTTIDDTRADPEEDYDTLNEADMDGEKENTDNARNNVTEQEKYLNILNSSPC